jgi:thiol-disulfide isomerase/thioredoxin
MTSKDFAFVVFFAPWCKHCKHLKPVFQELAKSMINTHGLIFATVFSFDCKKIISNSLFVKVDCTVENNLCAKNAIQGYPTLIWFENGVEVLSK